MYPNAVYVKAGVIDDQTFIQPTHESWCQSKVKWSVIEPELASYPKGKT